MKHDYISMSDDELERLSEKRDAKGRLTDTAKRAKHNLWFAITMKSATESAHLTLH